MWSIISWFANGLAILGAWETSRPKANLLKTNLLYLCANLYSVIYFLYSAQWPYFILYLVFLIFAFKGVYSNLQMRNSVFRGLLLEKPI